MEVSVRLRGKAEKQEMQMETEATRREAAGERAAGGAGRAAACGMLASDREDSQSLMWHLTPTISRAPRHILGQY